MDRTALDPKGDDYKRLVSSLGQMGLVSGDPVITPLTGGVSSLIVLVTDGETKFCAKSALAKLKVAEDWQAPVHRNQAEVAWMQVAGEIIPDAVPKILGCDTSENIFAMQWLDPDQHPVWKQQLLDGHVSIGSAAAVGDLLGRVHAATANDPKLAAQFPNDDDFDALRLDPYLRATVNAHPDLAIRLLHTLDTTARTKLALIHGDVSPKNILIGPNGPIILDAECATYGDPAFDLAFCLNHLIIKAAHLPAQADMLAESYVALTQAYLSHVNWEPAASLEARTCALLPALALARVDGKSPVEYLTTAEKNWVRQPARAAIKLPATTLGAFLEFWMENLS